LSGVRPELGETVELISWELGSFVIPSSTHIGIVLDARGCTICNMVERFYPAIPLHIIMIGGKVGGDAHDARLKTESSKLETQ
jgi:hypothetical protein